MEKEKGFDKFELFHRLSEGFPKEAYSVDSSRGFNLTSLKAQYIKERLNTVFSVFGWEFEEAFKEVSGGIICHGELTVGIEEDKHDIHLERAVYATGYSAFKKNMGDAYKGASTDALSKASSFIGIGNEVFKGNVNLATISEKTNEVREVFDATFKAPPIQPYPATAYGVCVHCDGWLIKSKSGKGLYCQNFRTPLEGGMEHQRLQFKDQPAIPNDIKCGVNAIENARKWLKEWSVE